MSRAYDAGNYAEAYDGMSIENSFVKWVTEMRMGFEVSSDWTPSTNEVKDFIKGFYSSYTEDEAGSVPSPNGLLNALSEG